MSVSILGACLKRSKCVCHAHPGHPETLGKLVFVTTSPLEAPIASSTVTNPRRHRLGGTGSTLPDDPGGRNRDGFSRRRDTTGPKVL